MKDTMQTVSEHELVRELLGRMAADLSMIVDREIHVGEPTVTRELRRAEGRSRIHISFKLGFQTPEGRMHGCLLVPLPDAISLAAYLMMVPDDTVRSHRNVTSLDRTTKEAMLEVGNFIGGAADAVVRWLFPGGHSVRSEGCQGVRANVRPALVYEEGSELVVARARARVHDFPEFELVVLLPVLPGLVSDRA